MGDFVFVILIRRCLNGKINNLVAWLPFLRSDHIKVIGPCRAVTTDRIKGPSTLKDLQR